MTDISTYLCIGWKSDGIEEPWLGRLWCLGLIHMLLSRKLLHPGRDSRESQRTEKEAKVHYTSILSRHWICHICQCPSGHWRSMTEAGVRGPLQCYRTWGKEYGRQMRYESSRRCPYYSIWTRTSIKLTSTAISWAFATCLAGHQAPLRYFSSTEGR